MTEKSEASQGSTRRKRGEHGVGASNVTAREERPGPEGERLMEAVVARENTGTVSRRNNPSLPAWVSRHCFKSVSNSTTHHEPPYTEPYVRWCGRTAGVTPPPTRSPCSVDRAPFRAAGRSIGALRRNVRVGLWFAACGRTGTTPEWGPKIRLPHILRRGEYRFLESRLEKTLAGSSSLHITGSAPGKS
jgi:hypothetical protein